MLEACTAVLWDWYFWCCARTHKEAYRAYDNDPTLTPQPVATELKQVVAESPPEDDGWAVL